MHIVILLGSPSAVAGTAGPLSLKTQHYGLREQPRCEEMVHANEISRCYKKRNTLENILRKLFSFLKKRSHVTKYY